MIGSHFFPHFGNLDNMSVRQITTPGTKPLFHNSSNPKLLMQSCVLAAKDRTAPFNQTLSSINAEKPLGSDIKMGYLTQTLTAVYCKHCQL